MAAAAAELFLPYLSPRDIASCSLTSKALHRISTSITAARSSDATRGFEKYPIPFINTLDSHPYSYFLYTPTSLAYSASSPALPFQTWGPKTQHSPAPISDHLQNWAAYIADDSYRFGCSCDGDGCCGKSGLEEATGCYCMSLGCDGAEVMTECGTNCGCGPRCQNRLSQGGVAVRLAVVRDSRKGWGLHAAHFIRGGDFICEYAGEFLTIEEARRRQEEYDERASQCQFSHALLVVREHLPSGKACLRVNIDATRVGNVARFINHSCDGGNLSTVLVRNMGALLPRLCFFAARDIAEGEELSFSYGDTRMRPKGLPCFCGSSCCLGTLPSEQI